MSCHCCLTFVALAGTLSSCALGIKISTQPLKASPFLCIQAPLVLVAS